MFVAILTGTWIVLLVVVFWAFDRSMRVHGANIEIGTESLFAFVQTRGLGSESLRNGVYRLLRKEGMSNEGARLISDHDLMCFDTNIVKVKRDVPGKFYKVVEVGHPGSFPATVAFVSSLAKVTEISKDTSEELLSCLTPSS